MIPPTAGAQASPEPKQFAKDYAGNLVRIMQEAIDERSVKYPLLTGDVGTTLKDKSENYV